MTAAHVPADCACCSRRAAPGTPNLCIECRLIWTQIQAVRDLDPYEKLALHGGMSAASDVIARHGATLDDYSEAQALELVQAIWIGCADELRRLIREGHPPF